MNYRFRCCFGQLLVISMLLRQCYMEIIVETNIGVIQGRSKSLDIKGEEYNVKRFLGIPYAKPPVGEFRFEKPQPADKFDTRYEAKDFRAACPQLEIALLPPIPEQSEDCLFLNVFVPDAEPDMDTGHAVMVWIHGGAFTIGSSDLYISDTLAAFGNVIVVTVNYRLGLLGFLSTNDEHAPGNYGLWDQHLAFRWVHDNIGSFGGDNNRVTIFGESAGGISVSTQALFSPNKGLFQRVISESGPALMCVCYSPDPLTTATFVAEQLGCSIASSKEMVSCLRQKDTDYILSVLKELAKVPENVMKLSFMPSKDERFIKFPPNKITVNEMEIKDSLDFLRSIDLMNGLNNYEGAIGLLGMAGTDDPEGFKTTREEMNTKHVPMATMMLLGPSVSNSITDMIISEYTDWRNPDDPELLRDQYVKLFGDLYFVAGVMDLSRLHSNASTEVNSYVYQFRPRPSTPFLPTPSWIKGANHGDEVGFVFGFDKEMIDLMENENTTVNPQAWEYDLSYNIMTYWTNFAKSGNPNQPNPVVATWPKYNLDEQKYLALDKDMSTDSAIDQFLYARETNFWMKTIPSVVDATAHAHDESSPFRQKDEDSCKATGDCGGN